MRPVFLLKAKYTRRWRGPDGKWRYEYGRKEKESRKKTQEFVDKQVEETDAFLDQLFAESDRDRVAEKYRKQYDGWKSEVVATLKQEKQQLSSEVSALEKEHAKWASKQYKDGKVVDAQGQARSARAINERRRQKRLQNVGDQLKQKKTKLKHTKDKLDNAKKDKGVLDMYRDMVDPSFDPSKYLFS